MGRQKHITKDERLVIQVGLENKRKIGAIAKELKHSKSCISKEIHNNTYPTFGYYNYLRVDSMAKKDQSKARHGAHLGGAILLLALSMGITSLCKGVYREVESERSKWRSLVVTNRNHTVGY